jgi:sulfate adenylyltransferase
MTAPHGGRLVDATVPEPEREKRLAEAKKLPKIIINEDVAKDIENIAYGVFSPLTGFLCRDDYEAVLAKKRLRNDLPWTVPIVLDVKKQQLAEAKEGDSIVVTDPSGGLLSILQIEEIYQFDRKQHAQQVYGTTDPAHPGVAKTFAMNDLLVGGRIQLVEASADEFQRFRLKPVETRVLFEAKGWRTIVGFQTRNVPHIGHEYVQKTALTFVDGLFVNPVIGKKKRGDFKDEVILDAYNTLLKNYYLKDTCVMAILRTEMRYAGPREAIFHAIIRKNFGCTHFVVGRDHAGVGRYYAPYAAQEIFDEFPDLGVTPLFFKAFFFCKKCGTVVNEKICPHEQREHVDFSGTQLRTDLISGHAPPPELIRPEVAEVLLKWKDPFVE